MGSKRFDALPVRVLPGGRSLVVARGARARLLGLALLAADELPADAALLIPSCRAIHTFGMRFPIDVAFLDARGLPSRVVRDLRPRRLASCAAAAAVLESRAGSIDAVLAGLLCRLGAGASL